MVKGEGNAILYNLAGGLGECRHELVWIFNCFTVYNSKLFLLLIFFLDSVLEMLKILDNVLKRLSLQMC